jgi:hypothetical protein
MITRNALEFNYYNILRPKSDQVITTEATKSAIPGNCYGVYTLHQESQGAWAFRVENQKQDGPATITWTIFWFQINGDYVFGNYDDHPKNVCTNPDV